MKLWPRVRLPLLIAIVVSLTAPLEAEAQGWEWIRKLSGPEYGKTVFGRVSLCLGRDADTGEFGITCGEIVPMGPVLFPADTRDDNRKFEYQVGIVVTRGWGGGNVDSGISDTNVWVVQPEFRVHYLGFEGGFAPVGAVGYGFHRFGGGTIPQAFWRGSVIITLGLRFPNPIDADRWRFSDTSSWSLFIEFGAKVRRFTTALLNEDFGATTATGELDSWASGIYIQLGFRSQPKRRP